MSRIWAVGNTYFNFLFSIWGQTVPHNLSNIIPTCKSLCRNWSFCVFLLEWVLVELRKKLSLLPAKDILSFRSAVSITIHWWWLFLLYFSTFLLRFFISLVFYSNSVCVNGAALALLSLLQRESLVFNVMLDSLLE